MFSLTAGVFSVVLVWSGWWGVNWGHASRCSHTFWQLDVVFGLTLFIFSVEYPIIGGLGGIISTCLALVTAHAKCCAPPPADRWREPPYTRAHPPRDGATATPLIKWEWIPTFSERVHCCGINLSSLEIEKLKQWPRYGLPAGINFKYSKITVPIHLSRWNIPRIVIV